MRSWKVVNPNRLNQVSRPAAYKLAPTHAVVASSTATPASTWRRR